MFVLINFVFKENAINLFKDSMLLWFLRFTNLAESTFSFATWKSASPMIQMAIGSASVSYVVFVDINLKLLIKCKKKFESKWSWVFLQICHTISCDFLYINSCFCGIVSAISHVGRTTFCIWSLCEW